MGASSEAGRTLWVIPVIYKCIQAERMIFIFHWNCALDMLLDVAISSGSTSRKRKKYTPCDCLYHKKIHQIYFSFDNENALQRQSLRHYTNQKKRINIQIETMRSMKYTRNSKIHFQWEIFPNEFSNHLHVINWCNQMIALAAGMNCLLEDIHWFILVYSKLPLKKKRRRGIDRLHPSTYLFARCLVNPKNRVIFHS